MPVLGIFTDPRQPFELSKRSPQVAGTSNQQNEKSLCLLDQRLLMVPRALWAYRPGQAREPRYHVKSDRCRGTESFKGKKWLKAFVDSIRYSTKNWRVDYTRILVEQTLPKSILFSSSSLLSGTSVYCSFAPRSIL